MYINDALLAVLMEEQGDRLERAAAVRRAVRREERGRPRWRRRLSSSSTPAGAANNA